MSGRKLLVIALVLGVAAAGCSGRTVSRLAPGLVDESRINQEADKAYAQVLAESKLSQDQRLVALVERVGRRIADASGEPFEWEIALIESDELNAWCMPGGKMAVYTGLLPVLETEAALAAVMGHEVAHATERHGMKGYAQAIENQVASAAIGVVAVLAGELLCQTEQCKMLTRLGGVAGALGVAFFQRKFSRDDETEADRVGQIFMARAGYDPAEAVKVWERMERATGGGGAPEFMSTHPSHENRQKELQRLLPEARAEYARASAQRGLGEKLF